MASQEDLDWLYGRERSDDTRVSPRESGPVRPESRPASAGLPPEPKPQPRVEPVVAPAPRLVEPVREPADYRDNPASRSAAPHPAGSLRQPDSAREPLNYRDYADGRPPSAPASLQDPRLPQGAGYNDSRLAPPPAPASPVRPRRRHPATYWARRVFVMLILLALAWAAFLIYTPLHWLGQVNRVDATPGGNRPTGQVGTAILITGSDSRENLTDAQAERLGVGGDQDAGRTDTMMLLYVPPTGKPALISLPRDSYVSIPGHGDSKLNAAYAWGGPKLLTQTLEQDFGLKIDGYASVGFAGFALLVDAVGGVDICVDNDIPAESVYPEIKAGCQTLDAPKALWYVRSRHSAVMQDLDRVQRQRKFLAALMKKLAMPETVVNPMRYWEVNKDLAQAVTLGKDTSTQTVMTMLMAMRSISQGKGWTLSLPISDPDADTPAGTSIILDNDLGDALFAQLKRGDTSNLDKYQK